MRTGVWETQLSMDAAMERAKDWAEEALYLIAVIEVGTTFTADDLRRWRGDPPNPNALGAVFRTARQRGLIRYTGEQELSHRPEAHGRWLRIWEVIAN